ncbi:hypothetical protein NDU88_004196 [Pleurodeles waltl]|uniref:Uncharacterized protein n=1 Tax=Pleurodeles waltl TaxID=8319 RepID=A0AAV7LNL6_PLEWA|nr:hypothetical protein NDU88_004196 [Pleurodeles waltl]
MRPGHIDKEDRVWARQEAILRVSMLKYGKETLEKAKVREDEATEEMEQGTQEVGAANVVLSELLQAQQYTQTGMPLVRKQAPAFSPVLEPGKGNVEGKGPVLISTGVDAGCAAEGQGEPSVRREVCDIYDSVGGQGE